VPVADIIPFDEAKRMEAVRRYDILDTPPDGAFDRITALAARRFGVPISIVSIVDEDRIWFKSHHGLPVEQIDREPGLCASAILGNDPYLLTDASIDPRSLANPLVAGDFGLRFYAGVPLTTSDGHNLGTLCVIDKEPRPIDEKQIEDLKDLASVVMDQIEMQLSARRAVGQAQLMAKEIDHRVMNSLQFVSGLLRMQSRLPATDGGLHCRYRRRGPSADNLDPTDRPAGQRVGDQRSQARRRSDRGNLYRHGWPAPTSRMRRRTRACARLRPR
jgi:hypothetical protein